MYILITGANRGLGFELSKLLSKDQKVKLIVAGRNATALKQAFEDNAIKYESCINFDLGDTNFEKSLEYISNLAKLDHIIHCASPYSKKAFFDCDYETIKKWNQYALNDTLFLRLASEKIEKSGGGHLVVAGAILAEENLKREVYSHYINQI